MSANAAYELRPITSLWWLPVLFGAVTLGVGVFFVVSPHDTLSTFTIIAGIFLLIDGVLAILRLDLRPGRRPRPARAHRRAQRNRRAGSDQEAV